MRWRDTTASLIALVSLEGCGNSLYGAERPFQAGMMGGFKSCDAFADERTKDPGILQSRFVAAACASSLQSNDDNLARTMLETSFSLTNARCTDYFAEKAGSQTSLNIARSIVAPAITLLTGVLSIVNFKNDLNGARRADWEKGLSLASAASLAGLTIWEENFLFSAENIDDVRSLTNQAMAEYRISVLKLTNHTFDTNVNYVLQYHMICTPGKIKGLVKQAIKDKRVTVVNLSASAAPVPLVAPVAPGVVAGSTVAGVSLEMK